MSWTLNNNGDWSKASNWSSNPNLPGSADNVTIDVGGSTVRTITHSTGTDSINSLTSNENLILSGGTLAIAQSSTMNGNLTLSGGTLDGSGNVIVNGAVSWTDGAMTGSGSTAIPAGRSLTLATDIYTSLTLGRTLDNYGSASGSGYRFFFNDGGTFNNHAGGTFTASGTGTMTANSANSAFNNQGTFVRSGAGSTTISAAFNNAGTISVQGGTLALTGGGTQTGPFILGGGTNLVLGGDHTFAAGAGLAGPINLEIASGTTTVPWALTITSGNALKLSGGVLSSPASINVSGTLAWTGGGMSGSGTTTLNGGSAVSINTADAELSLGRALDNYTQVTWTGGSYNPIWFSDATFTNRPGAAISVSGISSIYDKAGVNAFNNAGVFNRAGAGATYIEVPFNNAGVVNVQAGTLWLAGGGSQTGQFIFSSGSKLQLGGDHTFGPSSNLSGQVSIEIADGTSTFDRPLTITAGNTLTLSGGTLDGTADVAVYSTLNWSYGAMSGSGRTIMTPGSQLILSAADANLSLAREVQASGSTTFNGSNSEIDFDGGTFSNNAGAIFTATGATTLRNRTGTNAFSNAGTFTRAGTGTTSVSVPFTNTGAIIVQAGTLAFQGPLNNSGQIVLPAGTTLATGGAFSHAGGTIGGQGTLRITGGTATIAGPQNWGPGAAIEVSGGTLSLNSDAGSAENHPLAINVHGGVANFGAPQHLASLSIDGGKAVLVGGGANLLSVDALSLSGSGRLDVGDNDLVLHYSGASPAPELGQWIASNALFTSIPAAPGKDAALAMVDNNLLHLLQWHGETLSAGSDFDQLLVVYTWAGDANLDGQVTDADARSVLGNMGLTGASWFQGDVNGDGIVTAADLSIVTTNLGSGTGGALGSPLAAVFAPADQIIVPEPATGLMLLAGCAGLGLRRRRAPRP